jgi:hypothetical protein
MNPPAWEVCFVIQSRRCSFGEMEPESGPHLANGIFCFPCLVSQNTNVLDSKV